MSDRRFIAHARQAKSGEWLDPHELEDHLRSVASLAKSFAEEFGSGEWGSIAGLWHDLGKYRSKFQNYIRSQTGYEVENAHIEQASGRVTHSTAGAIHAVNKLGPGFGHIIAYLIAGHHAGLPDWIGGRGALDYRLNEGWDEYSEALSQSPSGDLLEADRPPLPSIASDRNRMALWMRLLFSSLVDADFLDTERYMSPEKFAQRRPAVRLADIQGLFFSKMEQLIDKADSTPINHIRHKIFHDCIGAANEAPGIFTLTVPTGGGKTLSSLAFALKHAELHGKRRIVYAIPFTSIIEQNAKVFRDMLGKESVLEHHSNLDLSPGRESSRSRLAAENWDFPLIVTTNVQLFESLFASRTSKCRKLHNLVDSVIVLDEAQQLPRDFHAPITQVMQQLSDHFGVTWLLCTATQPELGEQKDAFGRLELGGLKNIREIVSNPSDLALQLKRVEVRLPEPEAGLLSWLEVAEKLAREPCVLTIVNSRLHARTLYGLLPPDGHNLHLSANMCAQHRTAVLNEVKKRLQSRAEGDNRPLRVVSTQLIEAGVDVDFPVVYRAMAGLDSIAQSAGRCNREGKMEKPGRVEVFRPETPAPPGFLRQGEQTTLALLNGGLLDDPLSPKSFKHYFGDLNRQGSRDKYHIRERLEAKQSTDAPLDISFRTAAEKFRLIDNSGVGVIVPYCPDDDEESPIHQWLDGLDEDPSAKWIYRKLQRFSVNLPEGFAKQLEAKGALCIKAGQFVVEQSHYHDVWGLQPPDILFSAEQSII